MKMKMQTRSLQVFALALAVSLMLTAVPAFGKKPAGTRSTKAIELQDTLRDLWVDHIFWVRTVVLTSKYGDAEATKVAEANAVQNAKAIAASMVPFYGKDAGDKLFDLLAGHYGAVKGYMSAAYANDTAGMEGARKHLTANAKEIAAFLSSANPNWPKDTLESLLLAHGAHHLQQIDAINRKDFASEAETWAMMKKHMYTIADALAAGIVKQFPKRF
jgi:hypothetical protein